jgi:CheY-like chemotaxis protein
LFAQRIETIYRKDIQLVLMNIKEEERLIIETDALRLQQVITNLLENAIKFTENGVIEFGYNLIDVEKDNYVEFFVKDSGIGLSPDEQNIIFDRFTKIENSKTKLYRGAGLGLAICKNIVNLLGGEIKVKSNLKKGSTFSFTIPFIESEFGEKSAQQSFSSDYIWKGKTILIAEDEDSNFRFLEIILKETEAKLVRAANGIEVIEKFDDLKINLILMDIKMPLMNGFDATRKIRSINKEIPIIALTAFAMQNDENLCLEVGCNSYVSKPIHQELLLSIINKYLG